MGAFIELLKKRAEAEKKYFENPESYLKALKDILRKKFGDDVRAFLF